MSSRLTRLSALFLPLALIASPVMAQMPIPLKSEVRISVSMNMSQPISDKATVAQMQTDARKTVYELAGQECKLLLATLASDCHLEQLNVNSNEQSQYYRGDNSTLTLVTSSTASFRIRLKD
jgi:hypothetical protein